MNAYLFTSLSTVTQVRPIGDFRRTDSLQSWDGSASLIVVAPNSNDAQTLFEDCVRTQQPDKNPTHIEIRKIAGTQVLDQLLTEEKSEPLDWSKISELAITQAESFDADSFEQGYWVDVDEAVPPGDLAPNVEDLQRESPQDICSGLNWSAEKQFLFVLSVFSPQPTPAINLGLDPPELAESEDERNSETVSLRELYETFPQARDKEAAALIRARNSVVAAWLWRRYAASTHLAGNEIRIDPMCEVLGLPEASETQ
jgi:hypothetical protein